MGFQSSTYLFVLLTIILHYILLFIRITVWINNLQNCIYPAVPKFIMVLQVPLKIYKSFSPIISSPSVWRRLVLQSPSIRLNTVGVCSVRFIEFFQMIYCYMFIVVVRYIIAGFPEVKLDEQTSLDAILYKWYDISHLTISN